MVKYQYNNVLKSILRLQVVRFWRVVVAEFQHLFQSAPY